MIDPRPSRKPMNVLYAEWALWAWTAWTCLYGVYEAWINIPDVEQMLSAMPGGMVTIDPKTLLKGAIAAYVLLGVISAWIVIKIGAGKHWARSSLIAGFVLEALCKALPPYGGMLSYLSAIPDLGLQLYAIYMLYTSPGRDWFGPKP